VLLLPVGTQAVPRVRPLSAADLARRVLEEPWSLRVVDLRAREACTARRVPGAECVPEAELAKLGLADASPSRDLVLVADGALDAIPAAAAAFPGRVLALAGGWKAWQEYALTPPPAPAADADLGAREAFRVRAGLQSALTGMKAAPPPPTPSAAPAGPRRSGGGCSG
jgi:hypothetical protein